MDNRRDGIDESFATRQMLVQLLEACIITHEMQMRVFRWKKSSRMLRVELCVNYHCVCEFLETLPNFNESLELCGWPGNLKMDQITEVNYAEYN